MSKYNFNLRKTKIVCTIGPASEQYDMMEKLFLAGMSVVRCNFSHGAHEEHLKKMENARKIGEKYGVYIPVIADLQGPKHRIGKIEDEEFFVEKGDVIRFDSDPTPTKSGTNDRVHLPHPAIMKALEVGNRVLMDDAKIVVEVVAKGDDYLDAKVVDGGKVKQRKGFNIPDINLPGSILSEKDKKDLEFINQHDFDCVALSFVECAEDVRDAKKLIADDKKIIVKLERPQIIPNMEELVQETDIVMVARGDLGVEIPACKVPVVQKQLIEKCREYNKPVIVATHMMESMIENSAATRAEISDVANAVLEGTDCVMLSGETAQGDYPIETVKLMSDTIKEIEASDFYDDRMIEFANKIENFTVDSSIASSAVDLSDDIGAVGIFPVTKSGYSAIKISKRKPFADIVVLTSNRRTQGLLGFSNAVNTVYIDEKEMNIDNVIKTANGLAKEIFEAEKGDNIVITDVKREEDKFNATGSEDSFVKVVPVK